MSDSSVRNIRDTNAFKDLEKDIDVIEKNPDNFTGTDSQKIQKAVAGGGLIKLSRVYTLTDTITLDGNTQLVGGPGSKLLWAGVAGGTVIQDSSILDNNKINLNILLENIEIDGQHDFSRAYASLTNAEISQTVINFYRTGNITIRNVTVHGITGSAIRWGLSIKDTKNVLVENCLVYDCRRGDAIQGVGSNILVRNNTVGQIGNIKSNFGDTAFALLHDFNPVTNPNVEYTSDWEFSGNKIIGNYDLAGNYIGLGMRTQTGMAYGPFNIAVNTKGRIRNNIFIGCYVNLWGIGADNVLVTGNDFGSHAALDTANVRVDGITNIRIRDNFFTLRVDGTGTDFCAILVNAQRSVFGASVFDGDVRDFDISGNTITSIFPKKGIKLNFAGVVTGPAYTPRLVGGRICDNTFRSVSVPITLAPTVGDSGEACTDLLIQGNKCDALATCVLMVGGNVNQFNKVKVFDNSLANLSFPVTGSAASSIKVTHLISGKIAGAVSGTTIDLVQMPVGNYTLRASVRINSQNNAGLSASAFVHMNGNNCRSTFDNGGAMVITNPANTSLLRVTQTVGGNADIDYDLQYSL